MTTNGHPTDRITAPAGHHVAHLRVGIKPIGQTPARGYRLGMTDSDQTPNHDAELDDDARAQHDADRHDQLTTAPDATEEDAAPRIDVTQRGDGITRIDIRDDAEVRPGADPS
ncbi:MAG TPA: hypothetical protein VNJ54_04705 [Plantibacter sp.]|uniref:hypothetical protein n=1 Tax=unclassified Plantibacter TaxID=2624265 RepID=UPI002BEC338B|nr:hypothetical protein [Plantibacter sp.]